MTDGDPFNFDMSVSSAKKKKTRGKRGMSGAFETSTQVCDRDGCDMPGQYRAPKSPDNLEDFYWFCKDHVREYNLKWNFFHGTTEEEMEAQIDKDRVWGRKTKPFTKDSQDQKAWARHGINDPHEVLGDNATQNPGKAVSGTRRLPPTERRALEILEAQDTWTRVEIRKQYRSLIKVLHPDMNGGDRSDEERLQEVVWAWDQIKESRSFRD